MTVKPRTGALSSCSCSYCRSRQDVASHVLTFFALLLLHHVPDFLLSLDVAANNLRSQVGRPCGGHVEEHCSQETKHSNVIPLSFSHPASPCLSIPLAPWPAICSSAVCVVALDRVDTSLLPPRFSFLFFLSVLRVVRRVV